MNKQLITNKNNTVNIISEDPQVVAHFDNPTSYTGIILDQINSDRMYDPYFKDLKGKTIIDIGANVGLFTLYAQDENTVYSIEPTPAHFQILEKLTSQYPNVKRFNQALNSEDANVSFYCCDQNTTMNSILNKYGTEITVDGVRLDTFIKTNKIKSVDFVKIDIEGSEMIALTPEIINAVKSKVKIWFLEIHGSTADNKSIDENREIMKKRFEDCGIELENYRGDGLVSKI